MKTFDVVAVGSGTVDLIFRVPRLPGNDDKVIGKKVAELIGGTVANSACVMGKLGLRVTSLSTAGDDYYAQAIIDDFHRNGVDTRFILRKPGVAANMAIIFLDDSGEKALVYAPNDETETCMVQAPQAIDCSRLVYMMPGQLDKFRTLARYAREKNTKVVIDVESHIKNSQQNIKEMLSLSDVAIFNKEGFRTSLQQEPDAEVLRRLVEEHDLDALVVTCGGEGVIACDRKGVATHPGYNVSVIDTTGAGDTFNGAFIYCYLNNRELNDALSFASAAAAINISHVGARGKLSTVDDVNKFKEQYQ
ncbi:PfkB domain protein [Enterobacter sp. FY-07]|uniref:carbohydrate kinase family protein n=1 Tax=Kosakonia oryzendophytica TaxID=1005665 RepID=UPI000777E425|nr:carbohydrate kinase family protein [Kosakonia oryzendophytica]AMO47871.1 PfkB domain protein [Enterobacter sp. FY-07]WBT59555.1 carbohydrate kinase family protein [Kosakonia oryzendophytica]